MLKKRHKTLLALTALFSTTAFASPAIEHHHMAVVYIGQSQQEMIIEVHAPGMAMIGINHQMNTPTYHQAVHNTMDQLIDPTALFTPNSAAQCHLFSTRLGDSFNPEAGAGVGNDPFQHHNSFSAQYMYHCDHIDKLTTLGVQWFQHFPDTKQLQMFSDNPSGQKTQILTSAENSFTL